MIYALHQGKFEIALVAEVNELFEPKRSRIVLEQVCYHPRANATLLMSSLMNFCVARDVGRL